MGSGAVGCLGSFNCRIDHQPESGRTPPGEWRTASPTRWRVEPPRQGEGGGWRKGDGEILHLHPLHFYGDGDSIYSLHHRLQRLQCPQLHRLQLLHSPQHLHYCGGEESGEGKEKGGAPPKGGKKWTPPRDGGESPPIDGGGGGEEKLLHLQRGERGENRAGDLKAGGSPPGKKALDGGGWSNRVGGAQNSPRIEEESWIKDGLLYQPESTTRLFLCPSLVYPDDRGR